MDNSQKVFIKSGLVDRIAKVIARHHNFHKRTSLAYKCNNPGRLRKVSKPKVYDYPLLTLYGILYFPSKELGWKALKSKIKDAIERGWTLSKFITYNYSYESDLKAKIGIELPIGILKPLRNYLHD